MKRKGKERNSWQNSSPSQQTKNNPPLHIHLSLRPKSRKPRRRNPITTILHQIRTTRHSRPQKHRPIRRRNTHRKRRIPLSLRKHDAKRIILARNKRGIISRAPKTIRHGRVDIGAQPARVGFGADPDSDPVVRVGDDEAVGSGEDGVNVSLVVESEERAAGARALGVNG